MTKKKVVRNFWENRRELFQDFLSENKFAQNFCPPNICDPNFCPHPYICDQNFCPPNIYDKSTPVGGWPVLSLAISSSHLTVLIIAELDTEDQKSRTKLLSWNGSELATSRLAGKPANNNNYDNLYGAVTRPYRYNGALEHP